MLIININFEQNFKVRRHGKITVLILTVKQNLFEYILT